MAYTRNPTWQDSPSTSTPITAASLNAIENGLVAAAGVADGNTTAIAAKYTKPATGIPNSDLATPGGTVAAATTTAQGVVQLAGDLAGTAGAPTVPALAGKLSSTDPSVTNARTPTSHASSHATAGADPVSPASIGAATVASVAANTTAIAAGNGRALAYSIALGG